MTETATRQRWLALNAGASNWLWLSLLTLAFDQWTKSLILENFTQYQERVLLPVLDIVRWHNEGAAWSLLEEKPPYRAFVRAFLQRTFAPDQFAFELAEFQSLLDNALSALFERLLARPGMRRSTPIPELVLSFKTMVFGLTAIWVLEGPPFIGARMLTRRHMFLLAKGLEL